MSEKRTCCPVVETYSRLTIAEQAQIAKIPALDARLGVVEGNLAQQKIAIDTNLQKCEAAHDVMNEAIAENKTAIEKEKTNREADIEALESKIGGKADSDDVQSLDTRIGNEVSDRVEACTGLSVRIDEVATAVSTERANRESADSSIRADVDATVQMVMSSLRGEIATAKRGLEDSIACVRESSAEAVGEEAARRMAEDGSLSTKINDEVSARKTADENNKTLILNTEESIREDFAEADAELKSRIEDCETDIITNKEEFDTAKTNLESEDSRLERLITAETNNRVSGDSDTLTEAKDYAKSLLSSALTYQGQVADMTELETKTEGARKGDMYNVVQDGDGLAANYVFNGVGWDKLTESIDLSPYATKTGLTAEQTRAEGAEATLDAKIAANTAKINTDVGAEKTRAETAETSLLEKIEEEKGERESADEELSESISSLETRVTTEISRIEDLITTRIGEANQLAVSRAEEIEREYQAADEGLLLKINSLSETVEGNKTAIENSLGQEITDRQNAVKEVRDQLLVTDIAGNQRLVGMGEVLMKIDQKQDKLESGINIKTINGQNVLGSGNLQVVAKSAFVAHFDVNGYCAQTAEEFINAFENGEEMVVRFDQKHSDTVVGTYMFRLANVLKSSEIPEGATQWTTHQFVFSCVDTVGYVDYLTFSVGERVDGLKLFTSSVTITEFNLGNMATNAQNIATNTNNISANANSIVAINNRLGELFTEEGNLVIANEDDSKEYALGITQDETTGEDTLVITEKT